MSQVSEVARETAPIPAPKANLDGFTSPRGLPAVPLVIGVIGHRDVRPQDVEALEQELAKVFKQITAAYRHTPVVLLSSLAEGADQLAAKVAHANGIVVRAPLPFDRSDYRQSTSFDADATREKLDEMLDGWAVECFRVPLPKAKEDGIVDWAAVARGEYHQDPTLLDVCYANAGGYIVQHCNIFIALWNEDESKRATPSVTGQMVTFKLDGTPPVNYPWVDDNALGFRGECGPVYVIRTPRASDAGAAPVTASILVPQKKDEAAAALNAKSTKLEGIAERLHAGTPLAQPVSPRLRRGRSLLVLLAWYLFQFRRSVARLFGRKPAPLSTAHAELWQLQGGFQDLDDLNRDIETALDVNAMPQWLSEFGAPAPADMPAARAKWVDRLSRIGAAADRLAGNLDRVARFWQIIVFALLGVGVGFFQVYAHLLEHDPLWLVLFFATLLAGLVAMRFMQHRRILERRLDYRALAEALRVRRAWAIAGVGASVADTYLGQLRAEIVWVRRALRHVCPPPATWATDFQSLDNAAKLKRLEAACDGWVAGQLAYYRRSHRREHRRASFFFCLGYLLILLGWFWIPMLVFHEAGWPFPQGIGAWLGQLLKHATNPEEAWILVSAFLGIGGGILLAFRERRAHEELANQYERMLVVFAHGSAELSKWRQAGDVARMQAVLKTLGQEAVAEHAQWTILRRARPLELHVGG
jgi:F0F1-type ATP synthase assembly protein I